MEQPEAPQRHGRQTYLVYETSTGKVAHTVHVEVMRGARIPSETDIEKQVMLSASHVTGIAEKTLGFLMVDQGRLKPGMVYKVNAKTRELIEEKASSPKDKRRPRN